MTHDYETCHRASLRYLHWAVCANDDGERGAAKWFLAEWRKWSDRRQACVVADTGRGSPMETEPEARAGGERL